MFGPGQGGSDRDGQVVELCNANVRTKSSREARTRCSSKYAVSAMAAVTQPAEHRDHEPIQREIRPCPASRIAEQRVAGSCSHACIASRARTPS